MYIYYVLIVLWLIYYVATSNFSSEKYKLVNTLFYGISLFLVMGLRDKSVGSDISHYFQVYNHKLTMSNSTIEYGFDIYMNVLRYFGFSAQFFLSFTSLFIVFSLSRFFYKYSKNIWLSYYLHLTIGVFVMTMSGIRQSIAICIVLYAVDLMLKKRYLLVFLTIYIASIFHISALVFVLIFLCFFIKINSYLRISFVIAGLMSLFILKNIILSFIEQNLMFYYLSRYGITDGFKMNVLLAVIALMIPIAIAIMWRMNNKDLKLLSPQDSLLFNLTCVSTVISIFSLDSVMIQRLSYYFISAYIVLIPNVISSLKLRSNRILIIAVLFFVSFGYFVLGTINGTLKIDNYNFFF